MNKIETFLLEFNKGLSGRGHADRMLVALMPEEIKDLARQFDCLSYETGNKFYTFAIFKDFTEDDIKALSVIMQCGVYYYAAEFAKNGNKISVDKLLSITDHLVNLDKQLKELSKENLQRKKSGFSYNDAYIILDDKKRFFTNESIKIFETCKSIYAATIEPTHINGYLRLNDTERKTLKDFFSTAKISVKERKLLQAVCIKG